MIDQNQKNLDGEVSEYEHDTKDADKEVCMSEYPKDTNGKWVRVKGTGVAHTGDVVPLEGIKGPGSANTYFDGYAYEKHVGVPVAPEAKPLIPIIYIMVLVGCIFLGSGIIGFIQTAIGLSIGGLLTLLATVLMLIAFKMSCEEERRNAENAENDSKQNDVKDE